MGPFEQAIPWDTKGLKGAERFLEKIWKVAHEDIILKKSQRSNSGGN